MGWFPFDVTIWGTVADWISAGVNGLLAYIALSIPIRERRERRAAEQAQRHAREGQVFLAVAGARNLVLHLRKELAPRPRVAEQPLAEVFNPIMAGQIALIDRVMTLPDHTPQQMQALHSARQLLNGAQVALARAPHIGLVARDILAVVNDGLTGLHAAMRLAGLPVPDDGDQPQGREA